MRKIRQHLPATLAALAVFLFGLNLAFADGMPAAVTATPADKTRAALWGLGAMLVGAMVTFFAKRFSSWWVFHTTWGSILFALAAAMISAAASAVKESGRFDGDAVLWAVGSAAFNFFVTASATNPEGQAAVRARRALKAQMKASASGSGSGGRQALLYAILVLSFFGLGAPTCQSPGATALGNCEVSKLPQSFQTALVLVTAIAADPAKTADDFAAAGAGLLPGQLDCLIAAVSNALKAKMPSHGQADPMLVAMIRKLDQYSAKHPPSACGRWPALSRHL